MLAASLSLTGPSAAVVEGSRADFVLALSQQVTTPVTVTITTAPGTATLGQDYAAPNAMQILFSPGQIRQTFSIATLRDPGGDKTEGFETFQVIATPADRTLGVRSTIVTIADYVEPLPVVSVGPPAAGVAEGVPAVFTISLSKPPGSNKMVTVSYATANGTATAGTDYTAASGQVTFVGSETTKTVAVATLKDTTVEANETFTLGLSSPSGATLGTASATATILDTTIPPPIASITGPSLSVVEGYFAVFTVNLSYAPGNTTVSIPYATSNGTAIGGVDYTVTSGTLTFTGSEVSKTISVATLADRIVESAETFSVTLSNPINATIGTATATASITDPVVPTVKPPPVGTYTPQQIRNAYGINYGGDGTGTTIAIVDVGDAPTIRQDLNNFCLAYNLPFPPNFSRVNQRGGSALPPVAADWDLEITLDVEWAHAIAPGANILLVEADSDSPADLFAAVNYARNVPGVVVVSMSWGAAENVTTPAEIAAYDSILTTPSGHGGVSFVASAGDHGEVSYPASSANVLAVGGTQLTLSPTGGYGSEKVWNDFTTSGLATGGGPSAYVKKPAYQSGVNTGGDMRGTPDVAFSARDVPVYMNGTWETVVGTSYSAPAWAAIIAIADGRRIANGQGSLSSVQSLIYSLPAADFHDITQGNNGSYPALRGYDLVSGRGSPYANFVIRDLIAVGTTSSAVRSMASAAPAAVGSPSAAGSPGNAGNSSRPTLPVVPPSEVRIAAAAEADRPLDWRTWAISGRSTNFMRKLSRQPGPAEGYRVTEADVAEPPLPATFTAVIRNR